MERLVATFADRTFTYTQLAREGMVALYQQRHKTSGVLRYEVVRIKIAPEHTWPNGHVTPEREAYPGSTSWGRDGWTCWTLAEAQAKQAALLGQPCDPLALETEEVADPFEEAL